jgi:Methyltransferase domain
MRGPYIVENPLANQESTIGRRLEALDLGLFDSIESETSAEDRRSLLALQLACRRRHPRFGWLEVGSHLGGSLQALIRDPACTRIDSIDPRPEEFSDERLRPSIAYPDNSTERMIELLRELDGADVDKLVTHDAPTAELEPGEMEHPRICFVDGEHTDSACEADADFCRRAVADDGVIAFHDVWIVYRAIRSFVSRLVDEGVAHRLAYLPDSIVAVEIGSGDLLDDPAVVGQRLQAAPGVLWLAGMNNKYRAALQGRRARVLRRLGLLRVDEPPLR